MNKNFIELDEHLNFLFGSEAVLQKLVLILKIRKNEIPYVNYGVPIQEFSFFQDELKRYIETELLRIGVKSEIVIERGRLFIVNLNISVNLEDLYV